jgi:ankyrin repeat protein
MNYLKTTLIFTFLVAVLSSNMLQGMNYNGETKIKAADTQSRNATQVTTSSETKYTAQQAEELIDAAKRGDLEKIKNLLSAGVEVNAEGRYNEFALHEAVDHVQLAAVQVLLNAKAHVNAQVKKDSSKSTALILAAYRGSPEIVQALLNAHADIHIKNSAQLNALSWSIMIDHRGIAKMLIDAKADINSRLGSCLTGYQTPLDQAASYGRLDIVQDLLTAGAQIQNTALLCAAHGGHHKVATKLIERGAKIYDLETLTKLNRWDVWHEGNLVIIQALIAAGGDIDPMHFFEKFLPKKDKDSVWQMIDNQRPITCKAIDDIVACLPKDVLLIIISYMLPARQNNKPVPAAASEEDDSENMSTQTHNNVASLK